MLEVIYRIYEVADEETASRNLEKMDEFSTYTSISQCCNIELLMDCCLCDDREHFKSIIRSMYGEKIPFRYSKKLQPGDVYCVIIGEHCYNAERYFHRIEFTCSHCGSKLTTYLNRTIAFSDFEITHSLYGRQEYSTHRFCSYRCKEAFLKSEVAKIAPNDDEHFFVDKAGFKRIQNESVIGYIYKITKKSTGQFYVGQTIHVPIFRWGEHLHTDRFPLNNIEDYQFEVLATVYRGQDILEVEKSYIHKCYNENPAKSLNIASIPKSEVN